MNIVIDNGYELGDSEQTSRKIGTVLIRGNSIILWQYLDKVDT